MLFWHCWHLAVYVKDDSHSECWLTAHSAEVSMKGWTFRCFWLIFHFMINSVSVDLKFAPLAGQCRAFVNLPWNIQPWTWVNHRCFRIWTTAIALVAFARALMALAMGRYGDQNPPPHWPKLFDKMTVGLLSVVLPHPENPLLRPYLAMPLQSTH